MSTHKIGIITCSNAVNELSCCSVCCLADLDKRQGSFAQYPTEDRVRLVGIISCAGCPTLAYPEKIMSKVHSLAQFKAGTIHFSYCMVDTCPFQSRFAEAIRKQHPNILLVKNKKNICAKIPSLTAMY